MQLGILGSMYIQDGGQQYPVSRNQVRVVLALLALSCGEVVPIDHMVDELWEDRPVKNARNALQVVITRSRRFIEGLTGAPADQLVHSSAQGYFLDLPTGEVDCKRFDELAMEGTAQLKQRPDKAIDLFERALGQWRGTVLLDVDGGHRCRAEATRLTERRRTVRKHLIEAQLAVGQEFDLVSELKLLTAEYPQDERLSELLMLALYRSGRQSEALAEYQTIRSRLDLELGVEPGRNLRMIHQAILSQDRELDLMPAAMLTQQA